MPDLAGKWQSGVPQDANKPRRSRIAGNTSWFRSPPCTSCARCSISTISRSSAKMRSVKNIKNGHTRSIKPGMRGRRTDSRPNVRFTRCCASCGTYVIHKSIMGSSSPAQILRVWYGYSVRIVILSRLLDQPPTRLLPKITRSPNDCFPPVRAKV